MQGIVTDERGAYVKAAIINLIRAKDSEDGSGAVDVTYAETDDEGRFVIQDMNPDEKYIIEIHVKALEPVVGTKDTEEKEEAEEKAEAKEKEEAEEKAEAEPGPVIIVEEAPEPETAAKEEPSIIAAETLEPEAAVITEPKKAAGEPEPAITANVRETYYDPYDPYLEDEEDFDLIEEAYTFPDGMILIDSLGRNNMIEDTIRENLSCYCCGGNYKTNGYNPKDKPYLIKNNLW